MRYDQNKTNLPDKQGGEFRISDFFFWFHLALKATAYTALSLH